MDFKPPSLYPGKQPPPPPERFRQATVWTLGSAWTLCRRHKPRPFHKMEPLFPIIHPVDELSHYTNWANLARSVSQTLNKPKCKPHWRNNATWAPYVRNSAVFRHTLWSPSSGWTWGAVSVAVLVRLGLVKYCYRDDSWGDFGLCTKVKTRRTWSWCSSNHDVNGFHGNRHVYVGQSTIGWPARRPQPRKGDTKYTSASVFKKETFAGTEGTAPNVPWIIISDILRHVLGHAYTALGNTAVFTSVPHVIGSGTFYRSLRPTYMWFNIRAIRYDKFLQRVQYVLPVDSENYLHFLYKHQPIKLYFAVIAVQYHRNHTCH
jgi:hypothetical protein